MHTFSPLTLFHPLQKKGDEGDSGGYGGDYHDEDTYLPRLYGE